MNDNKATILKFPDSKIVRINPENTAISEARQKLADQHLADSITADLGVGFVLDTLEQMHGLDVDNPEFAKYFSLCASVFQAALYKYYGITHPLHEFIDKNVALFENVTPIEPELEVEPQTE
jgi:hypothetical protein